MRVIEIPETVDLSGFKGGKNLSFTDFIAEALDNHAPLGKGLKNIRRAVKLHDILGSLNGAKEIRLEKDQYETIKEAVSSVQWIPALARRITTYFDAVENAKEVDAA